MTDDIPDFTGITRRDYFAAQAMQALITNHDLFLQIAKDLGGANVDKSISKMAVNMADALIAELDKK